MNKFVSASAWIINDSNDEYLLIIPPTKRILLLAASLMGVGSLLIGITVNSLIAIITIPLFVYWIFYYYMFCKIWRVFKYSKVYLIAMPVIMSLVAFYARYFIYLI